MNRLSDGLFILAALIAAAAMGIRATPDVDAQTFGPEVTGGDHAWVHLQTNVPFNNTITMYTVPADRVFVLTSTSLNSVRMELLQDGVVKVPRWTMRSSGGPLYFGEGRVTFPAGSTVQVFNGNSSANVDVALTGYLAHP